MKSYQNQLDRFRDIAKKLVDQHSADLVNRYSAASSGRPQVPNEAYYSHLTTLGKQLDEQAEQFIGSQKVRTTGADLRTDVWNMCRKYLDQFIRRNQPGQY